jgi:hypothetical protein
MCSKLDGGTTFLVPAALPSTSAEPRALSEQLPAPQRQHPRSSLFTCTGFTYTEETHAIPIRMSVPSIMTSRNSGAASRAGAPKFDDAYMRQQV